MKAIHFDQPGPPEVLKIVDCKLPSISSEQILIKVKFAGINRPDIIQREGNYPAPAGHSKILGLEVSGIVAKIGSKVKKFKKNDTVASLVNGGGYSEYCIAEQDTSFKVPKYMSLQNAASIPECYFTAWSNLVLRGNLKRKQQVLVHGGTSGIGIAAIQILKLFDAKILTTVGNEEKERFCRDLGVDYVFNYKKKDFFDEIKKLDLGGLDIILDYIGGEYINKNINLLRNDGKLINIGFQKGANVNLNLMKVMLKRLTITGSTLRIRNTSFKGKILKDIQKHLFPNFKNGKIKCYIDSVFEMNEVIKAHKRLDEGKHIGKIILKV